HPDKTSCGTDGLSNPSSVGARHTNTHFTRAPFWADTFNLYSAGATYPGITNVYLQPDYDLCAAAIDANYCKYGWGSLHAGGINWLFGDGSVRNITTDINLQVFMALSTLAGGEGSAGKTNDKGEFTLKSSTGKTGAMVGTHRVSISALEAQVGDRDTRPPRGGPPLADKVPARYNSKSELTFPVPRGGSDKAD